jgi:hypothetical protein
MLSIERPLIMFLVDRPEADLNLDSSLEGLGICNGDRIVLSRSDERGEAHDNDDENTRKKWKRPEKRTKNNAVDNIGSGRSPAAPDESTKELGDDDVVGVNDDDASSLSSVETDIDDVLELICTTKIIDPDTDEPFANVRVVVNAYDTCENFFEDISSLWDRTGLKYRCGRTVLSADKTFAELGVESGSEIVVTGGRG